MFSRRSVPGMLHPWARAGSRRFPGDPSQAFALLQDPGRAGKTSPLAVVPTPPPGKPNRRPQRVHNLEANTGLQLPLSTLRERRRRLPRNTRFRLAGCASTGRESNPLDRFERFQVTSILLSRTSPVARFAYANQLPRQIESLIVAAKRDKPHWGARKIRELLVRRLDGDIRVPAKSTIHAVLHQHGRVKVPGRPRHRATGTPLSTGAAPNDLWCADFKGEFKLGNGRYGTVNLACAV